MEFYKKLFNNIHSNRKNSILQKILCPVFEFVFHKWLERWPYDGKHYYSVDKVTGWRSARALYYSAKGHRCGVHRMSPVFVISIFSKKFEI